MDYPDEEPSNPELSARLRARVEEAKTANAGQALSRAQLRMLAEAKASQGRMAKTTKRVDTQPAEAMPEIEQIQHEEPTAKEAVPSDTTLVHDPATDEDQEQYLATIAMLDAFNFADERIAEDPEAAEAAKRWEPGHGG